MVRRIGTFFSLGVLAQLVGILAGITQARTLGPDGKSVLAYAGIALGMLLNATDGLSAAVMLQAGRDRRPVRVVHAALRRVVVVLAAPVALLALVVGLAVPSQRPLLGVAAAIPFALYGQGARGLFLSAGRTHAVVIQGALTTSVFGCALIVLLLFGHLPPYGALALWVGAYAAAALYSAFETRRQEARTPPADAGEVRMVAKDQRRRATRNSAAMLAGFVNLRIDVFLVSAVLGARNLGIYTLAIMTGELLWSVSQPVLYSAMDRIVGEAFEDAAALVVRLVRRVLALEVVLGTALALAAPPLIGLVYGGRFAESGLLLRLLAPGVVAYSVEAFIGYFILVRLERPMLLLVTQSASALVCAAITLAGVRTFGLAAAAAATSLTYVGVVIFLFGVFCRAAGVRPRDFIPGREFVRARTTAALE